ncbi:MAG: VOC family protein [Alphaproteobacteria bacterium]|nr:VOC family protein [Alphaproteobacteria bacterium]
MIQFTFDYIHLRSPDPEATAVFYERMFGAEVLRSTQQSEPRVDIGLGGQINVIAPIKGENVAPPPSMPYHGLEHIGLAVTGPDQVVAELKAKGADFTMEPTAICPGIRICFLRGLENIAIEQLERST